MRTLAALALTVLATATAAVAAPHDTGASAIRARLISDAGDRGAVTISATRRGYFVDGLVAEVTRSPGVQAKRWLSHADPRVPVTWED